jgi:adenosylcobinamide kinase / adenosylcobinamide-phosphate guanylyltransferase
MRELIIGGARSGKSRLAESRAKAFEQAGMQVIYMATAEALDDEMAARLRHHQDSRPQHWRTVEEPLHLARALVENAAPNRCLLVDCLTLWLSAVLFKGEGGAQLEAGLPLTCERFQTERQAVLHALPTLPGEIIFVSNEIGSGVVPENRLARRFADEQGRLNQDVAALCERVTLSVAGLPLSLRG